MLTDSQIEELRALWRKEYGEDISRTCALEEGVRLLRFVALINNIKTNYEKED